MTNQSDVDPARLDVVKTRRRVEDALRKSITPEQLVGVAKELRVEVAMLPEPTPCHHQCHCHRDEKDRPDFGPDQVRCRCQLVVGNEYIDKHSAGAVRFRVLKAPQEICGVWIVDASLSDGGSSDLHLDNHNITPYNDGKWSQATWVAFTDDSRPSCCCCHLNCKH